LANSRQADLIGAKVMAKVNEISGEKVDFFGYGGPRMKSEGFT
jgi:lipid A disaccharide synthetase